MLFREDFDQKAKALWAQQRAYARAVVEDGVIVRPAVKLQFTYDEFHLWLWREIGMNAKLCPYDCGTPIDLLHCELDHVIPRAQDGAMSLDNLRACCERCNRLKGNMTGHSFRLLMQAGRQMVDTLHPKDWELLQKRILIGSKAQQERWRAIRASRELKKVKGEIPRRQPKQDEEPF